MSDYIYNSRFSFLARCWWQGSGKRIEPQAWDSATEHLAPIWVQFNGNDRWNRYLLAEPDGVLEKSLSPLDYDNPKHTYCELFWFGAYQRGSYQHGEQCYYEIRPVDRAWMRHPWVVDYNSSFLSGYVGIWGADEKAAALRKPAGSRLWTLNGLDHEALKRGTRRCNLEWVSASGSKVRRYQTDGISALNIISGEEGLLALEVLAIPYEFGEI
ncbi:MULTISPECIES: hypothetical protein [Pseudomonas]|uniref:Uncharacterized protein n=1 Tax=Pseudomonas hunanensis TaxID=1247546 RepID=A0ACC6K5E0_9PSED|nr:MULTISPECIES: hypothetical protein [Pseudomonas]MBP2263261.1 hypothetical protein [Pseudomonas sp. BP8]MDR6713630.1 hypothetical protein [Pseudomonas hunanensis]HDS1735292.1 hypothetical protein [Pseudomonas putida]